VSVGFGEGRYSLLNYPFFANRLAANVSLEDCCKEIFKKNINIRDETLFQKVWHLAINLHHIKFNEGIPLASLVAKIDAAIRDTLFYHGRGMDFTIDLSTNYGRIVKYLLGKGDQSSEMFSRMYLKSLVVQKDSRYLRGVREGLRQALLDCSRRLPKKNTKEEKLFQAFVGNIVAMLPYNYPIEGEEYVIPVQVNGEWKVCKYRIDKRIELTYQWFSTPITAYGLTAQDGPPLLTFLGTTCPTGNGFAATLLTDFTPGHSVGQAAYFLGRKKIAEWLSDKRDVRLFGLSLGGAIAFHVASRHSEKIGGVQAYNPPGLYSWDWKGKESRLPETNVYYQNNDLVATLGFFPEGKNISVYRVIGNKSENFVKSHLRAYTGCENVTILKSSASYENSRLIRRTITAAHFIFAHVVFIFVLLAHLIYCILTFFFSRCLSQGSFVFYKPYTLPRLNKSL